MHCMSVVFFYYSTIHSGVTGGVDRPGDTLEGWHPKEKIVWANLHRIVDKRGRTGEKGAGRQSINKSDSDE